MKLAAEDSKALQDAINRLLRGLQQPQERKVLQDEVNRLFRGLQQPQERAVSLAELDRLRGKIADAWDEGFEAGATNENRVYWSGEGTGVTNPYRKEDQC